MTLYLHLGAHKTATSLIQAVMQKNIDLLKKNNYNYVSPIKIRKTTFFQYLVDQIKGKKSEISFEEAQASFLKMLSKDMNNIISYESMLGHVNIGFSKTIYPSAKKVAQVIKSMIPDYVDDVKVIYYIRRQDTYLESTYLQQIHQGNDIDLETYLSKIDLSKLDWNHIIDGLADVFGENNLYLKTFEDIKQGSKQYVYDFFTIIGFKDLISLDIVKNNTNLSYSQKAYDIAQMVNLLLTQDEKEEFRKFLQNTFPNTKFGKIKFIDEETAKKILLANTKNNKKLFNKYLPESKHKTYYVINE